ncbi:catechol 2,3-dioxygenase-like lactoylglutathione lyase family enzyme [Nakamurella sp. UYEF19]|uniref:VOC family protein n=1 Tax=Nakamurella sp. UYEF19 TaxID=1756392 RepID=UPI003399CA05
MTTIRLLAQMTVTDTDAAEAWYTRLFGRLPDARPMPGLLEWHLADSFGVQVWAEAPRAGNSCMVLDESNLDELDIHLGRIGITHEPVQDATTLRVLPLQDPDGNRIVFTGPLAERTAAR